MRRKSKTEGIYVYVQLIPFAIQQKLTQHCTATILQYTLKKEKKRKACINSTNNNKSKGKTHLSVPIAQLVKNLPAVQETWVWFLGREDPLEKKLAVHSSILAWKIPWTEEPGRLQSKGSQRVRHHWATSLHSLPAVRPQENYLTSLSLSFLFYKMEITAHFKELLWGLNVEHLERGCPW